MGAASGHPFAAYDVHAYWIAGGSDHPYSATIASGFDDSVNLYKYRYPPPLAQVFAVLHLLPFPLVAGLWIGMLYAIVLVLGGRWAPLVLLFPPTLAELYLGNVNLLIALAIVVGFRWPATWSVVLLTKMTPGIGLAWFAFRREWRQLAIALGATAAVTAVSFVLAPQLWREFIDAMTVQAPAAIDVPPAAIHDLAPDPSRAGPRRRRLWRPDRPPLARPRRGHDRGAGALVERLRDPRRVRAAARGPRRHEAAHRPVARATGAPRRAAPEASAARA